MRGVLELSRWASSGCVGWGEKPLCLLSSFPTKASSFLPATRLVNGIPWFHLESVPLFISEVSHDFYSDQESCLNCQIANQYTMP